MTLLTIVRDVVDEVGLPRLTSVANGSSDLARQMFALANATLEEIGTCDWTVLETVYEFTTVEGQETYPLPVDFKKYISDTAFVSSLYYELRGSMTPAQWSQRRYGWQVGIGRYRFRMKGDPRLIYMTPIPQLEETLTMEYTSKYLAKDTNGVPIAKFFSDTDEPRVPEELVRMGLKWRIKHAKGLDYSEDFNSYENRKKFLRAQDNALGSQPVAKRYYADTPELGDGYVPETGYGQ